MKLAINVLFIGLFTALFCSNVYADEYAETRKMFDDAGISHMFDNAYGYAIFPTIGKAGFIAGGAYGKGRVYEQGRYIGDTTMAQVTLGFQLGGAGFSEVIFFQDRRALADFINGGFEFGAEAQAVAITAAAGAAANTAGNSAAASGGKNNANIGSGGYHKGMAIYTIMKGGLMYEVSVGGQKFSYSKR